MKQESRNPSYEQGGLDACLAGIRAGTASAFLTHVITARTFTEAEWRLIFDACEEAGIDIHIATG